MVFKGWCRFFALLFILPEETSLIDRIDCKLVDPKTKTTKGEIDQVTVSLKRNK